MSYNADPALTKQDVRLKLTQEELLERILIQLTKLVVYQEEAMGYEIKDEDVEIQACN